MAVVGYVILFLIVLLLLILLRLKQPQDEPPMLPGALPFIGHAYQMFSSTAIYLWEILQKLEDESLKKMQPFSIKIGLAKVYILSDPEDCYIVTQNLLDKPPSMFKFIKALVGDGLLWVKTPTWQRHRRLMNQMFSQHVLDGFVQLFNNNSQHLVADLRAYEGKDAFDPSQCIKKTVLKNTFSTLTGTTRYNYGNSLQNVFKALNILPESVTRRIEKIWFYYYDLLFNLTTLKHIQDNSVNIVKNFTEQIFNEKKIELVKNYDDLTSNNAVNNGEKVVSFLELFVQKEDKGLSKEEILSEINTLMTSSFDTSALSLIYALVIIGSHPEIQERIYEEIKENVTFDETNDFQINKSNVSKLIYLEAVVQETLRLHVILPVISRHLDKNIKLKNYSLYKGNECFILVNALHRHPSWGDDVLQFKPERWLNSENKQKNFTHLFAGFGIGKRNCIGKIYAMLQIKTQLAHILVNYKVYSDHRKLVKTYNLILEPVSGHHISIVKR